MGLGPFSFIPINVYGSAQEPLHGRAEQAFMSAHHHPRRRRRRHHHHQQQQLHLPADKIIQNQVYPELECVCARASIEREGEDMERWLSDPRGGRQVDPWNMIGRHDATHVKVWKISLCCIICDFIGRSVMVTHG